MVMVAMAGRVVDGAPAERVCALLARVGQRQRQPEKVGLQLAGALLACGGGASLTRGHAVAECLGAVQQLGKPYLLRSSILLSTGQLSSSASSACL